VIPLILIAAVVGALFGGIYLFVTSGRRAARKQGRIEAELAAEKDARKAEHEMADIVGKPRDPDALERKLRQHEF
jgi:hypothetical protein